MQKISKESLIENLKKEFVKRGISEVDFSMFISKGRTVIFELLNYEELEKIKETLTTFNDDTLLDGLYSIATELNIITKEDDNKRDKMIFDYLKKNGVINGLNEMKVINHHKSKIKIQVPFTKLNYTEKYIVVKLFSDLYMHKLSALN